MAKFEAVGIEMQAIYADIDPKSTWVAWNVGAVDRDGCAARWYTFRPSKGYYDRARALAEKMSADRKLPLTILFKDHTETVNLPYGPRDVVLVGEVIESSTTDWIDAAEASTMRRLGSAGYWR